ncbi:MAG: radical SAM protein [Deltaproteobacteria bacterium]|nr:radical SAM protein [Deltaproteobacteria bacterium]
MNCYFAISKVCNLRCQYCYVPEYNKSKQSDYNQKALESAKRFVAKVKTEKFGLGNVTLHGAEPTILSAETLGEVIKHFGQVTDDVRIQSNGTRFTPQYLDKLLGVIQDPKRLFVGISIDGSPEIHNPQRNNTWHLVMKNITELRKRGFEVGVLGVITSLTIKHLKEFSDWVESIRPLVVGITFKLGEHGYGITEEEKIRFAEWLYASRNLKHLQAFMPDLCMHDGNDCNFYEFDIDGNCYSCNKSYYDLGVFANWFQESFEEIRSKRKPLYNNRPIDPECKDCPYFALCHSGCPLSREKNKSVDCQIKQTVYPKLLDEGIRAENFFAIARQSTVFGMDLARYQSLSSELEEAEVFAATAPSPSSNELLLAEAKVILNPQFRFQKFSYPVHQMTAESDLTEYNSGEIVLLIYKDARDQQIRVMNLSQAAAKFFKILIAHPSSTVAGVLEKFTKELPDMSEDTFVNESLTFLRALHERNLLSFAASK